MVGYDTSPDAVRALTWAAQDAARRAVPLHVVLAWTLASAMAHLGLPFGVVPSFADCEAGLGELLAKDVAERVRAEFPTLEVHEHVVHGSAAPVLIAAARDADVLVVADRGHGGFVGLLLGSTAEQVLRHAPCTVVLVKNGGR